MLLLCITNLCHVGGTEHVVRPGLSFLLCPQHAMVKSDASGLAKGFETRSKAFWSTSRYNLFDFVDHGAQPNNRRLYDRTIR